VRCLTWKEDRWRLRKCCDLRRDAVGGGSGGAAGVVDDVADFTLIVEGDSDHVVKADVGIDRDFDCAGEHDVRMPEDAVDAESPGFVSCDSVGYFVRGPAVSARNVGEAGLIRRIVWDLRLVEVGAAAVTIPEDLELLVVFNEKAVDGDVVAIDDETVCTGVAGPADAGAMIGAPDPGVIDDGVVAVDFEIYLGAPDAGTPYAEEDVVERDGIPGVAGGTFVWADLKQDGRRCGARIEKQTGNGDAVRVHCGHGGGAVDGMQRGEAKAHDNSVVVGDMDGLGEIVDAGSEKKIFAFGELRIDRCGVVAVRVSDVELGDGDGFSWCGGGVPGDANAVCANRGYADAVVAGGVDLEKGFFANDWGLSDLGIGRFGPFALRRIGDSDKDHVPVRAGPAVPLAVAGYPLLLGTGGYVAVDERVGHPAAAGPAAILMEDDVALNVHTAKGSGLRDSPLHGPAGRGNGEVFGSAPEGGGRVVVACGSIGVNVAGYADAVG
jgi:hypothetical protein